MNKRIEKIIYKSFDSQLSKREKKILEKYKLKEVSTEKKRINSLRRKISDNIDESFSPAFFSNVMNKIRNIKKDNIIFNIFKYDFKIVTACASAICIILFIYTIFSSTINESKYKTRSLNQLIDYTLIDELEDLL